MATYGYLRVSTNLGQSTDNQEKFISDYGFNVTEFFSDTGVSGSCPAFSRPAFSRMMEVAKPEDTIIVVAVDRLGRSASDILSTVEQLRVRNIKVRILQFDGVDITSPTGKMILTCMSAMAELEKNLLVERVVSGLKRTVAQGTVLGAPSALAPAQLRSMIRDSSTMSQGALAKRYNVGISTIKRHISKYSTEEACNAYETLYNKRQQQHNKGE